VWRMDSALVSTLQRVRFVAGLSFREAWRRKVVIAALVMTVGFLALYGLGIHFAAEEIASDASGGEVIMRAAVGAQLLYVGLFASSIILGLLAVLSAAGAIAAEVDTGVLHGVLSRPIRRWELIVGKFLGAGAMIALYTLALAGAVVGLARWQLHAPVMHPIAGLGIIVLEPLILLALAILGSSRLSTMATGVLCVAAYGMGAIGGFIEQIGAFINNTTMMNLGIVSSLLVPVDAMHRKAIAVLLPATAMLADQMGPFGSLGKATPSVVMVAYASAYIAVAVWLATRLFARRDL